MFSIACYLFVEFANKIIRLLSPRSDIEREQQENANIVHRHKERGLTNLQTEPFHMMQTLVSQTSQMLDWRRND